MGEGYFEEIRGFVIEVTAWAGNQQRIPLSLSGPASFSSRRLFSNLIAKRGRRFTSVGYGLQTALPVQKWEPQRRFAPF
jgi:hypothetical protein